MTIFVALGEGVQFEADGAIYKLSKLEFDSVSGEINRVDLFPDSDLVKRILTRHVKARLGFSLEEFRSELQEEIRFLHLRPGPPSKQ
jgi:hypothetical protein